MAEWALRDRKSKLDLLEEYRRAREGGKRVLKERDDTIYDEVSEEQYKSVVRGRQAQDDFVVDDGVSGYIDNGMDDWGEDDERVSEEEDRPRKSKKKTTTAKNKSKYDDYVRSKPKAPPKAGEASKGMSAYIPVVSVKQEEDFMATLLGDVDSIAKAVPAAPTHRSRKRPNSAYYQLSDDDRAVPASSSRSRNQAGYRTAYREEMAASSDGFEMLGAGSGASSDDREWMEDLASPRKRVRTTAVLDPALDKIGKLDVKSDVEDDYGLGASFDDFEMGDPSMDVNPSTTVGVQMKKEERDPVIPPLKITGRPTTTNDVKKEGKPPTWLAVYDSLAVTKEEELGPATKSGSAFDATANKVDIEALEQDGSLRFFWLDYLEHEGKLYFIGKLKDKKSGAWVSCCVTVENLQRNLFVLPRDKKVEEVWEEPEDEEDEDDDDEEDEEKPKKKTANRKKILVDTDEVPTEDDVEEDFEQVRKRFGIKRMRVKFVDRKYAFGERDVPRGQHKWMKVVYGFDEPQIPNDVSSPNFSRVFGTNTSAFELLVLKRRIAGPCWLQIRKPRVENQGVSWCKFEAVVSDPKDINPFSETDGEAPKDMPPLTIMSLALRTIVNHAENKRELVCATARTWRNIHIDDPTPPEQLPCTVQTFVRPLDRFPPNFETKARANGKGTISPTKSERILLNNLLVSIYKADPDVLVGHDFLGSGLDVLLNRMRELKADHWSRIGRFRRTRWTNIGRQGTNLKFLNGRLLCDLSSDGAKGMISSTTWSLTEICKTHLKSDRQDIDPDDTASYFDGSVNTPDHLMTFVRHCELDAHYQMAIASKVQILPLTKQLTNLAGNSWNKTLNGGRAERNEYILLHEFHRLKYICPDKSWGRKFKPAATEPEPGEDAAEGAGGGSGKAGKSKRDKYKGGLVFEPKRGLWDKFILVMDFNSLYPSIIQEYNIDFTTVENIDDEDGEDKVPEPPSSTVETGVLPRLIATLVQRRRQVKALMKDRTATPARIAQYDIKQQALKLTANSMYGCLGFEGSRFYARPLAALTTYKGREILTHTRELAESLQLDVVYGDTDSVFVNSNVTELAEALKISAEFKKAVNERYKLLEIDLDGVFQRLLLLQKKKYAAIKVEDGTRTSTEVKGLDMKRREYSALSKNISQYVLERILSGEMTEVVVEQIHEYLTLIGQNVREGKIQLEEFIIFKRLGKNPEDYPDAKSQPHVQVALRMKARGGSARGGDVIPYVFCLADGADVNKVSQAELAKHPDEIRKADSGLKVDYEYYLSHQVLPPIERLCEPIEGTDRARLAECLGLDPGRYRNSSGEGEERAFATLDSQMSDHERFKLCDPFMVTCRKCKNTTPYVPMYDREKSILLASGPTCPSCKAPFTTPNMQVQLEVQVRAHISRYYAGWVLCDDQTCEYRTRMMSVYGRRCLRPGCKGKVSFEYTDGMLYNQLRFYASLFDWDKASKIKETAELAIMNRVFMNDMQQSLEKYLDQSGRRWVELGNLFSFLKI